MLIRQVDHHTSEVNTRPLLYPAKTRSTTVVFAFDSVLEAVFYDQLITKAVEMWIMTHADDGLNMEDMFVTIGWGSMQVIVEVSDRMRKD